MAVRDDSTRRWLGSLAVAVGLALAGACASRAEAFEPTPEFNPYEVVDIEISAVAEDAVAAKKIAVDGALRASAERVLHRVSVGLADGAVFEISAADAESLLATLVNSTESVGPSGYSAIITVTYSPILVRGYLARHGLGAVDRAAEPILLIPVVVEDGVEQWWEGAADWAEALAAQDMEDGLTPVRLPGNTAVDKAARRDRLMSADFVTLGEFRIRYRTHAAVIVRLDRSKGDEAALVSILGRDAAGPVNSTMELPPEADLDIAAHTVADMLSDRWKQVAGSAGPARIASGSSMPVQVLLSGGPAEWEILKRRLEASGAIDGLAVEVMGETSGNVVIWYAGRLDELPDRLARAGLDLFEAGGAWLLQAY